ncbi:MAG: phage baseplate assembly protein V [Candidatus Adiutrix sp.]|jgi:phage baseplate assembly protein V|nr:phage baseplate assembly protein V [Candidatus Adiutrix sp.]
MSADAAAKLVQESLSQVIRVGKVTGRDESAHQVRVEVEDTVTKALSTASLQVLTLRASGDRTYDLPDVGDQVLCLFLPFGKEVGFVLGCMYSEAGPPPVTSGDKTHREFKDGTTMEYDRDSHQYAADLKGGAGVKAEKDIDVKAPAVNHTGNMVINGSVTINGSLTTNGNSYAARRSGAPI